MTSVRSFAKINLGLKIGPRRADGFHDLRTLYQTIALDDTIHVELSDGNGIAVRCSDARVPCDSTNTCYKVAERVLRAAGAGVRVTLTIDKRLPVQGGMGAASSNAIAAMVALEAELHRKLGTPGLPAEVKLRIAAEVGSDLPLFLIGGTVLGVDRGQEVYPLADLPALPLVVVTPSVGVSTPRAFAQWDALVEKARTDVALQAASYGPENNALTPAGLPGTINSFSQAVFSWLEKSFLRQARPATGVPARGGDRAETLLLDLVRAGIENDFERVVFPEYPELREVKRVLERDGALYASLSGSGSTLYGIFASADQAALAAERMSAAGHKAVATTTLTREEYWDAVAGGQ